MVNQIKIAADGDAGAPGLSTRPAPARLVHMFKRDGAGQYCLSADRTGANIPRGINGETWTYVRDFVLAPSEFYVALDVDAAMDDIARNGYYLAGYWYDNR